MGSCDSTASYRSPYGLSYFRSVTSLLDNSDFGKFCAILGVFFIFYLHPSNLLWFHVTEYFVQFHMVLWDFDSCNLILDSSISF